MAVVTSRLGNLKYDEADFIFHSLTLTDIIVATEESKRRQDGKVAAGYKTNKADERLSDRDVDLFGVFGEVAVARVCGLEPEQQWEGHDYLKLNEKGYDLQLPDERTIHVRSSKPRGNFALSPRRGKGGFGADIGVLVWLTGTNAAIIGAFTKEQWEEYGTFMNWGHWGYRWTYKGPMTCVDNILTAQVQ